MITFQPSDLDPNSLNVHADNGVKIGEIARDNDGFFYFWPERYNGGFWAAYMMRAICDKMDEMNRLYEQQIDEYFAQHAQKDLDIPPRSPTLDES